MEEDYSEGVRAADEARSRELFEMLDAEMMWIAAELSSISFRAGVQAGLQRASLASRPLLK